MKPSHDRQYALTKDSYTPKQEGHYVELENNRIPPPARTSFDGGKRVGHLALKRLREISRKLRH